MGIHSGVFRLMSLSYWRPIVALAGWLALASHTQAQIVSEANSGKPNAAERNSSPTDNLGPALARIEEGIKSVASAIEATQADPYAKADQKRGDSDLKAQQEMARWAFWMFIAAAASVFLTGVGVFLIWRTLKATRDTLKEARRTTDTAIKAAETAEFTNKIAEATVDETRVSNERQLRAYVHVANASMDASSNPIIRFTIKNHGQTPAKNLSVIIRTVIQKSIDEREELSDTPDGTEYGPRLLAPKAETTIPIECSDYLVHRRFKNSDKRIYLYGRIVYKDTFDKMRFTQFQMCSREVGFVSDVFSFCHSGNEAT